MLKKGFLFGVFYFLLSLSALIGIVSVLLLLISNITLLTENNFKQAPIFATPINNEIAQEIPTPSLVEPFEINANQPDKTSEVVENLYPMTTEEILARTIVQENDPYLLLEKYKGINKVPLMLSKSPIVHSLGDNRSFWVLNVDKNEYHDINAFLVYSTPHAYFWIEEGIDYKITHVKALMDIFENQIYPRNRDLFGFERSPGVDNDVHLTILYANNLGGAAGYFSSTDSYPPEIDKFSNSADMFYLSADYIKLYTELAYGVLTHEFQHMIHWNIDRDEASWIDEGLSELAVELNGIDTNRFAYVFAKEPDLQLNFWPGSDQGSSIPHYGASYLFMKYISERFGVEFIKDLLHQQQNGFKGLDKELSNSNYDENLSGYLSEQIFQEWSLANYIQNRFIEDGIFGYFNQDQLPYFEPPHIFNCDSDPVVGTVNQFGTDYIEVLCEDDYQVQIDWNADVPLLSVDPNSGEYYFWSNHGNESSMKLSREFDLTSVAGDIELSYWTWFDLERDYDYLYLNLSLDGVNWQVIETPSCTTDNKTGSNLACGYNGKSAGWVQEKVDLSEFAGKTVIIEFEYITDASINGEGFLLDDIEVEAIGFFDDFESVDDSWSAEGFVQIKNSLPQVFGISLIGFDQDIPVRRLIIEEQSDITLEVNNINPNENEVLVFSGLTRYTHIPAEYTVSIESLN